MTDRAVPLRMPVHRRYQKSMDDWQRMGLVRQILWGWMIAPFVRRFR